MGAGYRSISSDLAARRAAMDLAPNLETLPMTMKAYGGFIGDKLDWIEVDDGFGGSNWRKVPAIFKLRYAARVQYKDVRKVEIAIVQPKRSGLKKGRKR